MFLFSCCCRLRSTVAWTAKFGKFHFFPCQTWDTHVLQFCRHVFLFGITNTGGYKRE